jgi:hypothetical protein
VEASSGEEALWSERLAIYADCVGMTFLIGSISFSHNLKKEDKVAHKVAKDCF